MRAGGAETGATGAWSAGATGRVTAWQHGSVAIAGKSGIWPSFSKNPRCPGVCSLCCAGWTCRWCCWCRCWPAPAFSPFIPRAATTDRRLHPWLRGMALPLVLLVSLLACAGLLAMYSSGHDHGTRFADHGRNMLIAGAILFVVAQVPPQKIMACSVPLYVLGVLLLVAVALFGITKKGAQRWIDLGIVIQPSEILKIATPLMLAWWFQKREGSLHPLDFAAAGLLLALPVGLVMKQPDLGTALLVLAAGLSVIFFAGLSWKLILPPVLLGGAGILALVLLADPLCADGARWVLLHDYQQQRICTLLDPTRDPLGKGFHIIQGMIAIGSGGIWGKGFMQGTQTHLEFIPERTTDFIFAAYAEEFGLVGGLGLIAG